MNITLDVKHITRRDTEQNWQNKNPILLNGERGYVTTGEHAGMTKTGDGNTNWNDLPFDKAIANGGNTDTINNLSIIKNDKIDPQYLPDENTFGNYKIVYNSERDTLDVLYIGGQ